MQPSRLKRSYIRMIGTIFTLCATPTLLIQAHPQAEMVSEPISIITEENLQQISTLFGVIHDTCDQIACLIKSPRVEASADQRAEYLNILVNVRGFVQMLQQTIMVQPQVEVFDTISPLLCDIIAYLKTHIETKFAQFAEFEAKDYRKRKTELHTNDEITTKLTAYIDAMRAVYDKSQAASLSALSRFYRSSGCAAGVEKFFIQWQGHWWLGAAALSTALAGYIWHHVGRHDKRGLPASLGGTWTDIVPTPSNCNTDSPWYDIVWEKISNTYTDLWRRLDNQQVYKPEDSLYKRVGGKIFEIWNYGARTCTKYPFPDLRHDNPELVGINPTGWVAEVDRLGHLHATHGAIIGSTLGGAAVKYGLVESLLKVKAKVDTMIRKAHAYCMGGIYYEKFRDETHEFQIKPKYTFDDIIGQEYGKQKLREVIKYIENPEKYIRSGLKPITTIILYGDSRTGKTMLIEGFAGELHKLNGTKKFPLYRFSAHHFTRNVFEFIMNNIEGPSVVFIDEFDLLPVNREAAKGGNASQLAEILNCLSPEGTYSKSSPDKPIIFIVAGNTPGKLDRPLLKRFALEIPFEKPTFEDRMIYLSNHLMRKGLSFHPMEIEMLTSLTDQCTYEDMSKIIEMTCFRKSGSGIPVDMQDIIQTINTEVYKVIPHGMKNLSDREQRILAIHMIGHMFGTMWMNNPHESFVQVTIHPVKNPIAKSTSMQAPTINYGRVITSSSGDTLNFEDQNYYKAKCMQALAGLITEEVLLEKQHITKYSCSCKDKAEALTWAKKYCLNGLDETELKASKHLKEKLATDAHAFLEVCAAELREHIAKDADIIGFLASNLMALQSLDISTVNILTKAFPKIKAGASMDQATREAIMEIQKEYEQMYAEMMKNQMHQQDETAMFAH